MKQLISVDDAVALVLKDTAPLPAELTSLHDAAWRVLAEDVVALRTQPPFNAAAMDGYAVCDADAKQGMELRLIGESAAGRAFGGAVGAGQTIRIFTGAPVPEGAGTVVMQEDVAVTGPGRVRIDGQVQAGRHVRLRGLDFAEGRQLLAKGALLDAANLSLAAAGGHAKVPVMQRPYVAILATGDELVSPGTKPGPDQIVASNGFGVAALARKAGADVVDLGIIPDDHAMIRNAVSKAFADGADILVTLGGASVGDHDLIRPVLADLGVPLGFWQIAMRPGKPLMHGRHGNAHVLGLPGNPVSSLVCAHLFLLPLIASLSGRDYCAPIAAARLGQPMRANDQRQDYVRARLERHSDGRLTAIPFGMQDSSMLSVLAASDCLIIRPPHAPATAVGDGAQVLLLR
jgi:molybdopterin molybdotransferase